MPGSDLDVAVKMDWIDRSPWNCGEVSGQQSQRQCRAVADGQVEMGGSGSERQIGDVRTGKIRKTLLGCAAWYLVGESSAT